jgi:hypothetical protein
MIEEFEEVEMEEEEEEEEEYMKWSQRSWLDLEVSMPVFHTRVIKCMV